MRAALIDAGVGVMMQPGIGYSHGHQAMYAAVALDNGCFNAKWDADKWMAWLERQPTSALFAVVPDVVGDADATRARWAEWSPFVKALGHRAAYVLQDGETIDGVPWDECDAVFIGGSTEWKLSNAAEVIVRHAKTLGKWVHMGRVNSLRRLRIAADWGCDSADGTYIAFGPDLNTGRLIGMLATLDREPSLFGGLA